MIADVIRTEQRKQGLSHFPLHWPGTEIPTLFLTERGWPFLNIKSLTDRGRGRNRNVFFFLSWVNSFVFEYFYETERLEISWSDFMEQNQLYLVELGTAILFFNEKLILRTINILWDMIITFYPSISHFLPLLLQLVPTLDSWAEVCFS